MTDVTVTYFEETGSANTDTTLRIAKKRAQVKASTPTR